ncbi:hypothetical protein AYK26_00765 [Euryarchaeota archaeon SM23-78]|nr:MAG: hypothetical protein AYK26_00765 [Euryarchaeota archaeon SM23-78]
MEKEKTKSKGEGEFRELLPGEKVAIMRQIREAESHTSAEIATAFVPDSSKFYSKFRSGNPSLKDLTKHEVELAVYFKAKEVFEKLIEAENLSDEVAGRTVLILWSHKERKIQIVGGTLIRQELLKPDKMQPIIEMIEKGIEASQRDIDISTIQEVIIALEEKLKNLLPWWSGDVDEVTDKPFETE